MWDKVLGLLGGNLFTGVAEIVGKFVTDPTKAAELHAELAKLARGLNAVGHALKDDLAGCDDANVERHGQTCTPSLRALAMTSSMLPTR